MLTVFHRLTGGLKTSLGLAPKATASVPAEVPSGTRFLEIQRRIRIYLRAMWNREFVLKQTDIEFAQEEGQPPVHRRRPDPSAERHRRLRGG